MAIPFYENEEELHQQQQVSEEVDQVDGPAIHSPYITQHNNQDLNSSSYASQESVNQPDLVAWKILALAMCKALKDHYQQNMANSGIFSNSTPAANTSISSSTESATAVIQILPNGQVKPQWN